MVAAVRPAVDPGGLETAVIFGTAVIEPAGDVHTGNLFQTLLRGEPFGQQLFAGGVGGKAGGKLFAAHAHRGCGKNI